MAENVKDSLSPPQNPPWMELPLDLTANILQRLGAEEILENAQFVCKTWRKVCLEPTIWRVLDLEYSPRFMENDYYIMCRCAVDRSQGQLIELRISYFGDDIFLGYIVDQASNLKCLTLRGCYDMNGLYLTEVIKKLPYLEGLHLTDMPSVTAVDVRAIGLNCPKLRSFSYNESETPIFLDDIDYALAISESMPNLRHLRYGTEYIEDEELEAILDGCPHLESLDLRKCYEIDVRQDLEKRCREQIKDLRLPLNSSSDLEDWFDLLSDRDDLLVDDFCYSRYPFGYDD